MKLSDAHLLAALDHSRLARPIILTVTLVLVIGIALLDFTLSPEVPVSHLYYLPILVAAVGLGWRYALAVAACAILLLHLADPALSKLRYGEADILRIALFIIVGLVAARLTEDRRQLRRLATTDDLTGLGNLRAFEAAACALIDAARKSGAAVALLSLDVDRLKALNDAHGHLVGAAAVKTIGAIIGRMLPAGACACRYGGDEFAIVVLDDAVGARRLSEDIRRAVAAAAPILDSTAFRAGTLSISAGVASAKVDAGSKASAVLGELFHEADAALYRAKGTANNANGAHDAPRLRGSS